MVFSGVLKDKNCLEIGSTFFVKISLKKAGNLSSYRKQDLCAKVNVKKKEIERMLQL